MKVGDGLNTNNNKSVLVLLAKSMVLGTLGMFFPLLYVFFPMLFLTEALEQGLLKILMAFVGVCLLLGAFSPAMGFGLFTLFGPLILILHYAITSKKSILSTLAVSTTVMVIGFGVVLQSSGLLELFQSPEKLQSFLTLQKEVLTEMGTSQEMIGALQSNLNAALTQVLRIMPAMLVLAALIISYVTYSFTGRNLLKKGKLIAQPPSFIYFSLPSGLVAVFVGLFFTSVLGGEAFADVIDVAALNLTVFFQFLFLVQGLALLNFVLTKYRIPGFAKWMGVFILLFTPGLQGPVAVLGLLDYGFNFRKIQRL